MCWPLSQFISTTVFQNWICWYLQVKGGKINLTLVDPIERANLSQCDRVHILLYASIHGHYFI